MEHKHKPEKQQIILTQPPNLNQFILQKPEERHHKPS